MMSILQDAAHRVERRIDPDDMTRPSECLRQRRRLLNVAPDDRTDDLRELGRVCGREEDSDATLVPLPPLPPLPPVLPLPPLLPPPPPEPPIRRRAVPIQHASA